MSIARPWLAAALLLIALPARAAIIEVGEERTITSPAMAVRDAAPGDTILIDAGEYYECLRVYVDGLTIEGRGTGAILTDTTCDGKAIVVAAAKTLTLRNLILQRARVGDGNGAGIRAEGKSLVIDKLRFLNDQSGLISTDDPDADILITDSQFTDTGRCDVPRCASAVSVGNIKRLRIARSLFTGTQGAHQIASAARRTELDHTVIEDGAKGSASFQVMILPGGGLEMTDCVVQKGPRATNLRGAVLLDGAMSGPVVLRRNRFLNDTGRSVPFVLDWSDTNPVLEGNMIPAGASAISSSGALAHYAMGQAQALKRDARSAAGSAKQMLKSLLQR